TDAAEVVTCVEQGVCPLLLDLSEEALRCRGAGRIAFFADFFAAPEKACVGGDDRILFLDNTDAAAQSVVTEFAAVGTGGDGGEAVLGIPLEGAGAVTGHVPVGVMRETLRGAGNSDLISTGPGVAAVVGRLHVHGVRADGECRRSGELVIRPDRGRFA